MPSNITARPTTDFARENIFNVIENIIDLEGITALDLFAGTGAISFEFLSRGCQSVTAVEKAATQYNFIRKVAQQLQCNNFNIVRGDALKYAQTSLAKFDIIFADPPYALKELKEIPDMILGTQMLTTDGILVFEHGKDYDFSKHPCFFRHVAYGSVNFSFFKKQEQL